MVPVAFGVLRTPPEAPLPERLAQLQADLDALFDDLMPSGVAVERILFQVNTRTTITVGQASGLALAAAARRGKRKLRRDDAIGATADSVRSEILSNHQ